MLSCSSPLSTRYEQDDDLVLELRQMPARSVSVAFNLSSSTRATRTERCPVPRAWYFLEPVPLKYKTIVDKPHIHIGRTQQAVSGYPQPKYGMDLPPWFALFGAR